MADLFDLVPLAQPSRRSILTAAVGGVGLTLLPALARAQNWPSRPIRIIVAQPPGGGTDATARAYADFAAKALGVGVVVDNRPGGMGTIAAQPVASSPPDGYTLLVVLNSSLAQAPVMLKKPAVDTAKDLTPIASFAVGVAPMCVHKDVPAKTLKELIALAKTRPVNVGNYAIGSGWQLMLSQLAKDTGAQFNVVNYRGTGQMVQDLMAGNIEVGAGSIVGMNPGIQSGNFRPVALITPYRSSQLPGIPTLVDEGFKGPAYEDLVEAHMLLGPANLPAAILARLGAIAQESVTGSQPMKNIFGMSAVEREHVLTGNELTAFVRRSWPAYQSLTRQNGITLE